VEQTTIFERFSELGPEILVTVIYDCGCFRGSATWYGPNGEDISVSLPFDHAKDDTDFKAFMDELYQLARAANGASFTAGG
jgi:hypothetical protein